MKHLWSIFAVASAVIAGPLLAQDGALASHCSQVPSGEPHTICLAVAQAAESAQPQVGILLSGGNPVLGSMGGGGGLRVPGLPNIDATARASVAFIRLPDILARGTSGSAQSLNRRLGVPAPALALDAAVGILSGASPAPGVGGIGSVDLLVSAAWLPFSTFGTRGFDAESPDLAWGLGARIGVLRESFIMPGISVSLMRRSLGNVAFGDVCRGSEQPVAGSSVSTCGEPGDAGEFALDITNWGTRAVLGKRFLGVGLAGGLGYDRYSSDAGFAFRYFDPDADENRVVRPASADLRSTRWSVFGNLSYQLLLASLAAEGGWQQGGSPIPGFQGGEFNPRGGAYFGSVGFRVAF